MEIVGYFKIFFTFWQISKMQQSMMSNGWRSFCSGFVKLKFYVKFFNFFPHFSQDVSVYLRVSVYRFLLALGSFVNITHE